MNRFVCVHGHFYQPPRENPWLEEVEIQDAARPYHDWNERITAECYRPNGWSRVLDPQGYIVGIDNNYSRISFNVGPTLLSWLERHAPDTYGAILAGDRASRERFSGHGSALAQSFNHSILPLASRRDKETQVDWGIRDFVRRFGRRPEGMWLPETAADLETLEVVAAAGIRFTILSPFQAARFRAHGAEEWTTPNPGGIPTTRVYDLALPHGQRISLFFYNGTISSDIAFRGLLNDGRALAARLTSAYDPGLGEEPQLSHVATDGETYGHHHRHGDMALAMALRVIEEGSDAALTNYGEFLERNPAKHEVEIQAVSSWSCAHGVERWRADCGCNTGTHPGWNQQWRAPLREALDRLRDKIRAGTDPLTEKAFKDPVAARQAYVDLMGGRDPRGRDAFLATHAHGPLDYEGRMMALRLMEIERQIQQMFTSCGWFFDEVSGIETIQVMAYASRAIQLAEQTAGGSYEPEFLEGLAQAKSNVPELGTGDQIYERFVEPARLTLRNVCAHYALSSLFEEYPEETQIYCYRVRGSQRRSAATDSGRLLVGQAEVRSDVTTAEAHFSYGTLFLAGQNLYGGVRPFRDDASFRRTSQELLDAFEHGDLDEAVRRVDQNFSEGTYTLRRLFRDEQQKIVELLYESLRESVEASFQRIYESTAPILKNLAQTSTPVPPALRAAAEFYLNEQIASSLGRAPPDVTAIRERLRELESLNLNVDTVRLPYEWALAAERLMEEFPAVSDGRESLKTLLELVTLARDRSLPVDLSRVQNRYFGLLHEGEATSRASDPGAASMKSLDAPTRELFHALGEQLRVRVG
jgi:alpha-amylase/alpha-mannosidase (GH57 family)